MVMTMVQNERLSRNEWVKGVQVDSSGAAGLARTYYIAVDDSTDGDVVAAGSLQGLSVRGDYEISTSQFVGNAFKAGTPLTPATGADDGRLKEATSGDVVIAHVVKDYSGPVDLGSTYTDLLPSPPTTVSSGVKGGVYIRPRETNAVDLRRLRMELVPPYTLA